jgi:acylphosphatase
MIVARRYVISGRVQGVGFRYFTEDLAQREGVSGFVRNLPDGRVEAVVAGDLESVGRVDTALWNGPRGARVDDIEIEETTPSGRLTGFRIRA